MSRPLASNHKTVAIVQARMGSTRAPGKVMRCAAGQTFLAHLIERLRSAHSLMDVVVATSNLPQDDPVADEAERCGVAAFRGSEQDVLDRYYNAARQLSLDISDVVVRVTADCPLLDPRIVDALVARFNAEESTLALVTNRRPLTFPDGMDADVFTFGTLEEAWTCARLPGEREHVVPWIWANKPFVNVVDARNLFFSHRFTVDYPEDIELVTAILEGLYRPGDPFSLDDLLVFVERRPELLAVNRRWLPDVRNHDLGIGQISPQWDNKSTCE